MREINELFGDSGGIVAGHQVLETRPTACRKGVLSIEHRALNPNNEFKRIFGSKIIQSEQRFVNKLIYVEANAYIHIYIYVQYYTCIVHIMLYTQWICADSCI